MTDITPGVEQFMRMIRSICEFCDVEIIECAVTALVEERDQAVKENSKFKANSQTFLAATKFTMDKVVAEQERLAAQLSTKCGCIHINVSEGPHPELAAKDRMYATEVCWYHRFVHEERDALRQALELENPALLDAIDQRMEEK